MTGCIDRKTGKVTIVGGSADNIDAIVKRLLSAAKVVEPKKEGGKR